MTTKPAGITIGIKAIKLLHFEATSRVQQLRKPLPSESYEFQFDLTWTLSEEEKAFNPVLSVTLYEKQSPETKVELANMKVSVTFAIVNYEEVVRKENGQLLLPDQLITVTAGIVVSTLRGMFALSIKDLIINNAIIPIINPQAFLPAKSQLK